LRSKPTAIIPLQWKNAFTGESVTVATLRHADAVVKGDKDMTTNIHRTRNQSYGEDHPGEGDIFGRPRGPANRDGEI
jgi:hypothetical protein